MARLATTLLIIGGLNWLLVGLFQFNLVDAIFGAGSVLSRIVYILVGLSAVYEIFLVPRLRAVERETGRRDDFRRAA